MDAPLYYFIIFFKTNTSWCLTHWGFAKRLLQLVSSPPVEYIFPVEALICILGCVLLPSNNCCEWDEGFSRGEKKTESGRMDNEIKSLVLLAFCEHLLTDFRPDNQPLGTVRYHHQKRKVCRRASSFWSEVPLCRAVLKSVSPQACPRSL